LFFDFAGYSAFAIGLSYLFGVHTPENFHLPFLARNIRDFWNRWHISLSFWFRDHVYMRFLLTAGKAKWFKGKHTASYLGLFLTFGLMGIWHGTEAHYLIYGVYHAVLLCGYDAFARWNKKSKAWPDGPAWRVLNIVLTIHAVCFGLLIFSGHLNAHPSTP
jgi:membrane protein involved in D-alanine export